MRIERDYTPSELSHRKVASLDFVHRLLVDIVALSRDVALPAGELSVPPK